MLSSSSNWLVDVYGGLGLRSRNMVIVNEDHDFTTDPAVSNPYTYTITETTDNVPALFLGVKLGLGF